MEKNKDCAITIIIYKPNLSTTEYVSFSRLCRMYGGKYDIFIVTSKEIDILNYINIAEKYDNIILGENFKLVYVDHFYISGRIQYQLLTTSTLLYSSFINYKYIFNYHLDCYIFKDELQQWIDKDYDQCEVISLYSDRNLYFNGQGLRKTQSFINALVINFNAVNSFRSKMIAQLQVEKMTNSKIAESLFFMNGEDIFLTQLISPNIDLLQFKDFGYSALVNKLFYKDEGKKLPMMIHNFGTPGEWITWEKEIIGDWDIDPEACINKEF